METPHQQSLPTARSASGRSPIRQIVRRAISIAGWVLLVCLFWIASDIEVPATLAPWTGRLQGFTTVFLGIFIEALPFLLAGVLVSSVLHLYVSTEQIQRLAPRNPVLGAFSGALLGLALPVCECGSIPAARRLLQKGAALPVGIAFVLAAPVINPIVIVSTLVAFGGWEIAAWRVGLTLLFAVIIGVVLGAVVKPETVLAPHVIDDDHDHHHHDHDHHHHDHDHHHHDHDHHHHDHDHHHHDHGAPGDGKIRRILSHAQGEFFEMGRFLVIGALLAAALQTLIPQQALLALGNGPVLSILVMMGLAVVLSVCSTVDSFIALSFVNTFTPGAILAFLVFGPMIDIKSTLMLTTTFRRHIVVIMALLCFQLTLLAGIITNFFLW